MIQANELRIGNWVERIGWPLQVIGIKNNDVFVDAQGVELEYYIYDGITPIPLTEEWVVRFGFTRGVDFWFISDFIVDINPEGFESRFKPFIQIKSVHQLQNLYFALTGEELKLKEL